MKNKPRTPHLVLSCLASLQTYLPSLPVHLVPPAAVLGHCPDALVGRGPGDVKGSEQMYDCLKLPLCVTLCRERTGKQFLLLANAL